MNLQFDRPNIILSPSRIDANWQDMRCKLRRPICTDYVFFLLAAALAFAAFFLLLRIIIIPRKDPTTVEPKRVRMTGIRIAQTRGGKRSWRGCP